MKAWRIKIEVTLFGEDAFGVSGSTEFERDNRDAAHGFGISELQRLIDRAETITAAQSDGPPQAASQEDK